jgi:hypothetical protein
MKGKLTSRNIHFFFLEFIQVTLTVDGLYTERWMTSGSFSILASSTVFLGGSEATFSLPGTKTNNNLVGCIKKVGVPSLLWCQFHQYLCAAFLYQSFEKCIFCTYILGLNFFGVRILA